MLTLLDTYVPNQRRHTTKIFTLKCSKNLGPTGRSTMLKKLGVPTAVYHVQKIGSPAAGLPDYKIGAPAVILLNA